MSILPAGFLLSRSDGRKCTVVPRSFSTLHGSLAQEDATMILPLPSSSPPINSMIHPLTLVTVPTISATLPGAHPYLSPPENMPNILLSMSRYSPITEILISPVKRLVAAGTPSNTQEATANIIQSQNIGSQNTPANRVVPIVGGVLGFVVLIGLIGLIFQFLRRKKARNQFQLPFLTGRLDLFYDIPNTSPRPIRKRAPCKTGLYQFRQLGANLRSRFLGGRGASVRPRHTQGNSQIFYGRSRQHSRDNSLVLNYATRSNSLIVKTEDWFMGLSQKIGFPHTPGQKSRDLVDPFAKTEKQAYIRGHQFDFCQSLNMVDRKVQLEAERIQASLISNAHSVSGSPGYIDDFSRDSMRDSCDISHPASNGLENITVTGPYSPIPRPLPITPKTNNYIADIRRSRGQSMDFSNNSHYYSESRPSSVRSSRYPSTIAPIRDSYRDSVYSSASSINTERRYRGRSDPFDLDRPELWLPQNKDSSVETYQSHSPVSSLKDNQVMNPCHQLKLSSTEPAGKEHHSDLFLMEWGDPGPDVGCASSGDARNRSGSHFPGQAL